MPAAAHSPEANRPERRPPTHIPAPVDPNNTRVSLLMRLKSDGPAREIAWSEFYLRYGPVIARYARRSGATSAESDDVVQHVMSSFYSKQPTFEYVPQRGRFRNYLKTCARNATISLLRKRRRENAGTTPVEEIAAGIADEDAQGSRIWDELWEAEQLKQAIDATQQRYASNEQRRRTFKAFEMYVLLGQPAPQVAERLDISLDSVHAAKTRVTKALREELAAIQNETD